MYIHRYIDIKLEKVGDTSYDIFLWGDGMDGY